MRNPRIPPPSSKIMKKSFTSRRRTLFVAHIFKAMYFENLKKKRSLSSWLKSSRFIKNDDI